MQRLATAQNPAAKKAAKKQVLTFFVQDMMFGLNVENVLMLDQNVDRIQPVPLEERGFCGVVKFQGTVVPVLDFAHRLGIASGLDDKKAMLEQLKQHEATHLSWVNSLAEALRHSQSFYLDLDVSDCASTLWFRQFESRDETLNDLINAFREPHQALHEAGALAVRQAQGQDPEKMAALFTQTAAPYLQKMHSLSRRAREQVESDMRQVLLFVTDDGKTPRYALLIDEINDVISYDASSFQSSSEGALAQVRKLAELLGGVFSRDNEQDCLFIDINKLAGQEAVTAT
jgi:chemotaxis signal transduction protein